MTDKPKKLYKYISSEFIGNVFNVTDRATMKFSLPKDFNDPYELFLTVDYDNNAEELAFYLDIMGENTQFPVTCFSRSPIVIPMWAHYAQNHQGFVIEFSEEQLLESFPDAVFGDVKYSDTPRPELSDFLTRAYRVGKYRHTHWLRNAVLHSAYFTKMTCWSYEQERRMIVEKSDTRAAGSMMLLDVPRSSITNIICGARASDEAKAKLAGLAEEVGCDYHELRVGRSSATPYLTTKGGQPFLFDGSDIGLSTHYCEKCREPTAGVDRCSWCEIDDELRHHVASRNPFRILDRYGLLESYIAGMDAVRRKHTKKE